MKTKLLIIAAVLIVCSAFALANVYNYKKSTPTKALVIVKGRDYEKEWKKIDSLEAKGLTTSALALVETIYKLAKAENNAPQLIKAVIHRMKFVSIKEEAALEKSIGKLTEELKTAKYPLTPVLHSIIAETYWNYFQNNRWKLYDRTQIVNEKPGDIATWDKKTLLAKAIKHYQLSVRPADSLKRTQLNIYDDIVLTQKESKKFRPTVYDFLAHRAIDFYSNEELYLSLPASKFELTDSAVFSNYKNFNALKFTVTDSLNVHYYAVKLFQELLQFHATDASPEALVVLDIERLKFVSKHAVVENKEQLYLKALQQLEQQFIKSPASTEVSYEIASVYNNNGLNFEAQKNEVTKQGYAKAVAIATNAISRFPDSYGAKECQFLIDRIKQKNIALTVDEVNVPDKPFLALLNYRNLTHVYFRIIQLPFSVTSNPSRNNSSEEVLRSYLTHKPIKEWSVNLPADEDYQQHSIELKLPALPAGNYVVLTSTDKAFITKNNGVTYTVASISNISYISRRGKSGYDFYVSNRETGEPLRGVKAQLTITKYDYSNRDYNVIPVGNYTSNEQGYLSTPLKNENNNFNVQFSFGKDTLLTDNNFYIYHTNNHEKQKTIRTFFFTDRAIYRPGQTIYFKGIVLETDGENNQIKENYNSTITFYDVNGQKITDAKLTTNSYGTFNGTFTAPNTGINGAMRIGNEKGDVYISVEEYKRPKYEVKINPVKGSFRLNEMVTVNGFAKAYTGAAVDKAQVNYRVVRNAVFDWWYFRSPFPTSPEMEITNGTATTSDTGSFILTFKAIPDFSIKKELKPMYNYTVYVDVTDISGETQSTQLVLAIGYSALTIKTDVPQQINKDSAAKFTLAITNSVGEPEPATGKITVYKLNEPAKLIRKRKWNAPDKFVMTKEEFDNDFPHDAYMDEDDIHKWKQGAKITELNVDTKKEKTFELPLATMQLGTYVLEAKTTDVYGEEVKTLNYFTLYTVKGKEVPHVIDWFTVVKGKGEPGQKALFVIGSKEGNVKVLYEIEHNNEIVKKEWLTLNKEQKLIEFPLEEKHRGNVVVHFVFVKNNRAYARTETVIVPYTNKELDITVETFRDKLLPGQQEEWKLKIKAKNGEKIAAEMLAAMYDASLDAFKVNQWNFDIYNTYYARQSWSITGRFGNAGSVLIAPEWNNYLDFQFRMYDQLNWFGYIPDSYQSPRPYARGGVAVAAEALGVKSDRMNKSEAPQADLQSPPPMQQETDGMLSGGNGKPPELKSGENKEKITTVATRKNLTETAFFFPTLQTDESGNILIRFTTPEALTKWKFMALAHTRDLKYAQFSKEVITQKELMVIPNAPRFFREQDKLVLTGKITNLATSDLQGSAQLTLYDAVTMKDITPQLINENRLVIDFNVKKGQSTSLSWALNIPQGFSAITYKMVAKSGAYSDGEEMAVPVLTNRMLVTESMPLAIRTNQTKTFTLDKLLKSGSSTTLRNHKVTLEFTANPAWYAVQALPYMMELPDGCSEQTFSRFYANSIASHVATSSPKIQAVFNAWKNAGGTKQALTSNLEKNQELKAVLIEETPWVLEAKDETERKNRLGLLFDLNTMSYELGNALAKLEKMQTPNGGWPWFEGMPDDRYITQYIVAGMGHLNHLNIKAIHDNGRIWNMIQQGVKYLDRAIREDYERLITNKIKLTENNLSYLQIHYLYARSYFKDIAIDEQSKKAVSYYKEQAQKFWLKNNPYMQGMLALTLNRDGDKITPKDILKSLKENALYHEELGMYWKENTTGYYWHQAFVESQALLIEAFDEIANDKKSVDELKIALLKSKQTQNWKTSKATAEACYALLLRGTDWLATESNVAITVANQQLETPAADNLKEEAGTGYLKKTWNAADVKPELGKVTITKKDNGISWGALYWQYFEQLDKITPAQTPLSVEKQVYLQQNTASGPVITAITEKTALKVGDKLKIRIILRADRDMEYIHLKDMRAAGLEPVNIFSGYRWQGGLGYYETTRDAATHFFISYLVKGTYVFEYPLLVSHAGDFSNGITTLQCMYAPEFSSHSEGIRIKVGN